MKHNIMSIKDRLAGSFQRPWASPSLAVAMRAFMDEIKNPETALAKHPEDYDLYEVGEFDDDSGSMTSNLHSPRLLLSGIKAIEHEIAI
ncbi:MAG: nonstructural protein [Microviridae sp.]|nr:MAG: nonstructural protein [Microviridae sp.]